MNQNLMPDSRPPNQTLPSFRELEATIEASILEDNKQRLADGKDITSNGSARCTPYPPYPAHGFNLPTDASCNAYRNPGFSSDGALAHNVKAHVETTALRDAQMIPLHPTNQLPLHCKKKESSPASTQLPTIPEKSALPEQAAPDTREVPPRPPLKRSISQCSSSTERLPPASQRRGQTPMQKCKVREDTTAKSLHSAESAHSNWAHLRKIGVQFTEVAAHTAKCDECNRRNQGGMSRCKNCGWQICKKCKNDRAGDQSHASFGAVHVPEVGGDIPLDGTHDKQGPCESPALEAAQTLVELADTTIPVQNGRSDDRNDNQLNVDHLADEGFEEVDDASADSDVTMSMGGDDECPVDDAEMAVYDDGLLIGYLIARRNPTRAARPSSKMTE